MTSHASPGLSQYPGDSSPEYLIRGLIMSSALYSSVESWGAETANLRPGSRGESTLAYNEVIEATTSFPDQSPEEYG